MEWIKQGEGRPVVFLHAALTDSRSFERVAALRPEGVAAWFCELPDHVRDEPGTSLAGTLDAVRAALLEVPAPFTFVGHSIGAYLGARLFADLGDRIARAVCVGGFATLPQAITDAYAGLAAGIDRGVVEPREAIRGAVEAALGPSVVEADRSLVHGIASEWPVARIVRCLQRVAEIGAAPPMPAFRTPTVVLHAADDASVPLALGRGLAALGARVELSELADGGHFLPLSHPEIVARLAFSK